MRRIFVGAGIVFACLLFTFLNVGQCFSIATKRIVVLNTDIAEVIQALGGENYVVGVCDGLAQQKDFFIKLKDKESVGKWDNPDYEKIISLRPDYVIAYGKWPGNELEEKLNPLGIKVLRIDCYFIDKLDIRKIKKLLKKKKEAEEYIKFYKKYLELIKNRTKNLKRKVKVYGEAYSDYTTNNKKTGHHQMITLAGGINIAENEKVAFPKIDAEWIIKKNPEVIVKPISFLENFEIEKIENVRKSIKNRPGFNLIKAIKKDRVYLISSEIYTGPRVFIGILHYAKWFYPELFKDINPEEIHKKLLKKFHNIKLKGVYAYP